MASAYSRQQRTRPVGVASVDRTYMNVMQAAGAARTSPAPAVLQQPPGLGVISTHFVTQIRSGVPVAMASSAAQSPKTLPVVPQSQEVKRFHKEPSYSTVLHSQRSAPVQAPAPTSHLYVNYNPLAVSAYASSSADYAELDRLNLALEGGLSLEVDPSRQSYASPPSPVSSSYSELRQATKFPPGFQMQKYLLLQQQQMLQPADSIYEPVTQQYEARSDYNSLNRSSSSSESGSDCFGPCFKCRGRIVGENTGCEVKAMNRRYHIACFTCHHCHCQLQGIPFFPVNSRPYCEECHLKTLERCCKCMQPITDRILRATGKPYHPQCFTCVVCNRSLDGIQFTVDATNKIHCIEDFHRRFAPKCSVCKEPIMPEKWQEEMVRVVALDRSFHIKCYRCEDCNLELYTEEEGRGCYPLDDHVLCKRCNTKRIQELTSNLN